MNDVFEYPVISRLRTALAHLEARVSRLYAVQPDQNECVSELRSQVESFICLFLAKLEAMNAEARRPPIAAEEKQGQGKSGPQRERLNDTVPSMSHANKSKKPPQPNWNNDVNPNPNTANGSSTFAWPNRELAKRIVAAAESD